MQAFCPNLSNKKIKAEFEELKSVVGENLAYLIWHKTEGEGLGNHPGSSDSVSFKDILNSVNGNRNEAITKASLFVLNEKSLLKNIFDLFDTILEDREEYIKQVEEGYKKSNKDLSEEELNKNLPRIRSAARVQYNKNELNKILLKNQEIFANMANMLMQDGIYVLSEEESETQKNLYEFVVNSLSEETFNKYKSLHPDVYNIMRPNSSSTINIIYKTIYDGDLYTINKELARDYIRLFWNSELIQAGLHLFNDGNKKVEELQESLVSAITEEDPRSVYKNNKLDYILQFWNKLINLAKSIFVGAKLQGKEKASVIDGIKQAMLINLDLEIENNVNHLYDRIDGDYSTSKYLSPRDIDLFDKIKSGTKTRLRSQLNRNIKNNKIISDLRARLDILDLRDPNSLDDVFNTIEEFLTNADVEIKDVFKYINTKLLPRDISTWDVKEVNFIKQDMIGFYQGLLQVVHSVMSDTESSLYKANQIRTEDPNAMDLVSLSKQLEADINSLYSYYVDRVVMKYADRMLVDFVNESDVVEDKPVFIQNMRRWLLQDTLYGDLLAGELAFGMASRSRSPIIRIVEKMMSDTEFEKNRVVLRRGKELIRLYNKIRPIGSQIGFSNFLKLFIELDGEDGTSGLPTGYFVRDRNYGRFYSEKDAYEELLRNEFASEGLTWRIDSEQNVRLIFPEEDHKADNSVYNRYYDKLDEWLDKHCERRYTLDYYKNKRRFLSPEALLALSFLLRQIDLLCQKAVTESGMIDTNKLKLHERATLKKLRKQKQSLSSPYIYETTSDNVVTIREKEGEDARIAQEIRDWNKHLDGKINYVANKEKFERDLLEIIDTYGKGSEQERRFIRENKIYKINPILWQMLAERSVPLDEKYKELASRYRDIINHIKDYEGYAVYDLSKIGFGINQDTSVWKELLRLDQEMSDIRNYPDNKNKKGDRKELVLSRMIPSFEDRNKTFFHFLLEKWTPSFQESPSAVDVFNSLFKYVDHKGTSRILRAFAYLMPASEKIDVMGSKVKTIIETYSSVYNELDEASEYVNKNFDRNLCVSLQPKIRKHGEPRKKGQIDYTNENYKKILENADYKAFYDLLIQTMNEANQNIPQRAKEHQWLMPQITGRGLSILGRTLTGCEFFSALGYGVANTFTGELAEMTSDVSTNWDLPRRPDGTVVSNIPIRFVRRLPKPYLISTDVIGSVMMYYDMAMNFSFKSKNLPSIELLEEALKPKVTSKNPLEKLYKKLQNMLDFRYYGKEDRNVGDVNYNNKFVKATTTIAKRVHKFAALSMLAMNWTTIEVGYIDALCSAIADSIGGKYFGKRDLLYGYGQVIKYILPIIGTIGTPDSNNWMSCAMLYNQLSMSNSELFDRTDQSKEARILHNIQMGGYTVADYIINVMILGATYHHYRLVDLPDGSGKKFMSKELTVRRFAKFGYTRKEAIKKYEASKKTLKDAYDTKEGMLYVKDEYKQYVNTTLENEVAGRLRDRTYVYNGVIPATEKAKIALNVFGSFVVMMRNFYINTYWERAAVGYDYATEEDIASSKLGMWSSDKQGYANFETGESGTAIGISFLKGLYNMVKSLGTLFSKGKLSNLTQDQKYSLKRIFAEISIIGVAVWLALLSIGLARGGDYDDDKTPLWNINFINPVDKNGNIIEKPFFEFNLDNADKKILNWVRWKTALLSVRTLTERSTFYWPGTIMELINSPSTAKSYLDDLGYTIDLFMDLFSINGHDSRTLVKSGGYAGVSRGTRDIIKIASSSGLDNAVRGWHTSGIKSTLNWYLGISPTNFIIPNKSTWENEHLLELGNTEKKNKQKRKKTIKVY